MLKMRSYGYEVFLKMTEKRKRFCTQAKTDKIG